MCFVMFHDIFLVMFHIMILVMCLVMCLVLGYLLCLAPIIQFKKINIEYPIHSIPFLFLYHISSI